MKRWIIAAAGAMVLGGGWLGCSTDDGTANVQHDSGVDATNVTVDSSTNHDATGDADARPKDGGTSIMCGPSECQQLITVGSFGTSNVYTLSPCCPSSNPQKCGIRLPQTGACVEREQAGMIDLSCPRFVIPQRNRDGGIDADPDGDINWYTLRGCCKSSGQCGYWDGFGDASYTLASLGCVYHRDFGDIPRSIACDPDGGSTADAQDAPNGD